ncbi:hypothetical protein AB8B21_10050 [Tardiphaga sp. 866_E4_N2_1]|uniref:hypothetical protein n=1 Tax=unclassified Tardiphaga TaxID=2631404 RepID=UPI003F228A16
MGVKIDEAGRHQFALGIDALLCALRWNARLNGGDLPELDADIANAAQILAGVDDLAARITRSKFSVGCWPNVPPDAPSDPSMAAPPANTSRREILATDISAPEPKSCRAKIVAGTRNVLSLILISRRF